MDDRVTEWWEPLAPWSLVEGCPVTMFMVWQTTVHVKLLRGEGGDYL